MQKSMQMANEHWIFLFSYGVTNVDGEPLHNQYVKVYGSLVTARGKMERAFSNQWKMQYNAEDGEKLIEALNLTCYRTIK